MNNLTSLIFYIIMFIISSMIIAKVGKLYRKKSTNKNIKLNIFILTIIGLSIPIIISGLRYNVGTDYEAYVGLYNRYSDYTLLEILSTKTEFLFFVIIKLASLFNNYQATFFIMAFLTVMITYFAILNNKEKLSLGFMFFIYLFMYFTNSFNWIRQALAIAIILYSYKFIFERNWKKFTLAILIASLFHVSALLFWPFYFVYSKEDNKKGKYIRWLYIILTIIVVLNYEKAVNMLSSISVFEDYAGYTTELSAANREAVLNFIILAVILIFRKMLIKYDERNELYIFFYIISTILTLIGYITPFAKRIAVYFGISAIFILSSFPNIAKTKEQKIFIYFLISCYVIGYFILSIYILKQGNMLPYQTIIGK